MKRNSGVSRKVEAEVRRLRDRLDAAMPLARFIARTQVNQLATAERLRVLAKALVKSEWQHRCKDRVGGCTAVSDFAFTELEEFLKGLRPFHNPKRWMPAAVAKLVGPNRRKR